MHNLAIALFKKGYQITGSDDAIHEPSKSRLLKYNLLPQDLGWFPERISTDTSARRETSACAMVRQRRRWPKPNVSWLQIRTRQPVFPTIDIYPPALVVSFDTFSTRYRVTRYRPLASISVFYGISKPAIGLLLSRRCDILQDFFEQGLAFFVAVECAKFFRKLCNTMGIAVMPVVPGHFASRQTRFEFEIGRAHV